MPPPSKKRKTAVAAPESITFDPAAREEYLTGFHKRKVARTKLAQEENAKREKEEKVQFRREVSSRPGHADSPSNPAASPKTCVGVGEKVQM